METAFSNWQGRVIFGLLPLNSAETVTVASAQAVSARTVSADYPAVAPLGPREVEPRQGRYEFQHLVAASARDIPLRRTPSCRRRREYRKRLGACV
jgi:hypothetical protein